MFFELPVELQREIYEFDPTFRVLYRDAIRTLEYKYTHNNTRCYNPITGNHQYFHQDILIADCYYNKHHRLHGPYTTYSRLTGFPTTRFYYHDGQLHGTCDEFDPFTGLCKKRYVFRHGKRISYEVF